MDQVDCSAIPFKHPLEQNSLLTNARIILKLLLSKSFLFSKSSRKNVTTEKGLTFGWIPCPTSVMVRP